MEVQKYTQMELLNKIQQSNYSYRNSKKTKVTEVDENVGKLGDNVSAFNKSARWLKKYKSGASSKTRLEKEITSLIKSYNEMGENADSITDKDIKAQMSKIDKLFAENEENFSKIGVEKVNGKYKLDSKKFDDADEEALSALFEGNGSFMNKVDKIMRQTEKSAESAHYSVVERNVTSVMEYKEADVMLAKFMVLAEESGKALQSYNDKVQAGGPSTQSYNGQVQAGDSPSTYKKAVVDSLGYFAIAAYKRYEGEWSGNLYKLQELCLKNEEKLKKVGIVFDDEAKKTMSFNPDKALPDIGVTTDFGTYMETDNFKAAYKELFGSDADFVKKAVEYSRNVYNSIAQPSKIGVSIIDVYA